MRPLRRRALSNARPPLLAMRARNPILRTRLIFEGCHIIFMLFFSYLSQLKKSALEYHTAREWSTRAQQHFSG
jgi:hypothetical protein